MSGKLKLISTVFLLSLSSSVFAATSYVETRVDKLLIGEPTLFGGCMAQMENRIDSTGLNCPGKWVSFSCSGDFHTKDLAYKLYDAAQMSLALGNLMRVYVDDTKKHNGYCVAFRIEALPPAR